MNNLYKRRNYFCLLIILFLGFTFCKKKDPPVETVPNNKAPYYAGIPRVKVENYVNRLFIDIIGREALTTELKTETDNLIANTLSVPTRETLITKLQSDPTLRAGDSSYAIAAGRLLYDMLTIRLCEGFGEADFKKYAGITYTQRAQDSIVGNWANFYDNKRKQEALEAAEYARWDFLNKKIDISDYCTILINNSLTFGMTASYMGNEDNTVTYTFNDLLFRKPTLAEFNTSRQMILFEEAGVLFDQSGSDKGDYFKIITHCNEFYGGTIKWLYNTFIARDPTTEESVNALTTLPVDKDIFKIQRNILKTDEYANF